MLLLFWLLPFFPAPSAFTVAVDNIAEARGQVLIAVYDKKEDFLNADKACYKQVLPVRNTGSLQFSIPHDLPANVAVSCFHDLNSNGKLDKNLVGIPTEPYGFSNNARPSFRAPNWEEAAVYVRDNGARISLRLEKW